MLRRVAAGDRPESLRLYQPDAAILFSTLDARRPGYAQAVERARALGFEPVIRLAGGHAAAFLEASMAFAWATPDAEAQLRIRPRFERLAGWIVKALRRLDLDARLGAVPGEYCPGEYSVNIAGRVKVMGVGQRVIRGGAHVGGVLTVGQSQTLRALLIPVYEALEIEFAPETAGGIADFDPSLDPEDVITAIVEVLEEEGHQLEAARFDASIRAEAETLRGHHTSAPEATPAEPAAVRPRVSSPDGKTLVQTDRSDSSDPTRSSS